MAPNNKCAGVLQPPSWKTGASIPDALPSSQTFIFARLFRLTHCRVNPGCALFAGFRFPLEPVIRGVGFWLAALILALSCGRSIAFDQVSPRSGALSVEPGGHLPGDRCRPDAGVAQLQRRDA